jgi:hypothetical protein
MTGMDDLRAPPPASADARYAGKQAWAAAVDEQELEAIGESLGDGEPAQRRSERAAHHDHRRARPDAAERDRRAVLGDDMLEGLRHARLLSAR